MGGATSFARPAAESQDLDIEVYMAEDASDDEKSDDDSDDDDSDSEMNPNKKGPVYNPGLQAALAGNVKFLMTSQDFGVNWNWTKMPDNFQAGGLAVDPTNQSSLFGLTTSCLAHSTDRGLSWSPCSVAPGLTGSFSALIVKDSKVMFLLRT